MILKRNSFRVEGAGVRDAFPPPIVVCGGDCYCGGVLLASGRMVVGRTKPVGLVLLIAQGWRR